MTRRRKDAGRRFLAADHEVLDHPAFMALSARGKSMILLLLRRFNGRNNGRIVASFRDIQGFVRCHSRHVLPTIQELEASRLALRTKVGVYRSGGSTQASEWRITFLPVGDAPATHDYRRPRGSTDSSLVDTKPKTKPRSHSGSGDPMQYRLFIRQKGRFRSHGGSGKTDSPQPQWQHM